MIDTIPPLDALKPRRKKYQPTHAEVVARLQAEARARHLPEPQEFVRVSELAIAARVSDDTIIRRFALHPQVVDTNAGREPSAKRKSYRVLRIPLAVALDYLCQRTPQVQASSTRRKFTTEDRQRMMRDRWAAKRAKRKAQALRERGVSA